MFYIFEMFKQESRDFAINSLKTSDRKIRIFLKQVEK
mgnify:CR=1 FL=1|tara:strand:- start:184 stop:294 length:111 start_codon:yes stop_codon:yes gene_type:complete